MIRKPAAGRLRVALVYPNVYHVGMSNLGFQTVYRLINEMDQLVCERAFFPDQDGEKNKRVLTVESQTPIEDSDIIAFSISYENDAPAVLSILDKAGLPLSALRRDADLPLVLAGGVFCFLNPEPLAPFIDAFLLGEAEALIPAFFDHFDPGMQREALLLQLACRVEGLYVPRFYQPYYDPKGRLERVETTAEVPSVVRRQMLTDLSKLPTASTILTPDTTFADTYLIEVSRGCPHGCRFCSAGYVYRPPRYRPVKLLHDQVESGCLLTNRIGLVGAAVSDLPGMEELCRRGHAQELRFSFSSLRADALDDTFVTALQKSRVQTATIAPDAGSARMRHVINKGIDEEHVIRAAEILVAAGIPNLKLYFMVGLPTEEQEDVQAIVELVKQIKHRFLATSRGKGRMGTITVSVSSFVPKAFTPFQWVAMDEVAVLKQKIKQIKSGLKKTANVRVHADVPRWAFVQAVIARGDRRVADLLRLVHANRGNWAQSFKSSPINPQFYVHRERDETECFPWEVIDQGIDRAFLYKEYQRALAARPSADCPADPEKCSLCGVCKDGT